LVIRGGTFFRLKQQLLILVQYYSSDKNSSQLAKKKLAKAVGSWQRNSWQNRYMKLKTLANCILPTASFTFKVLHN
jgi:hypothetical protein